MLLTKIGTGIAIGASLAFATSPALAAGWTIVGVPPTGQNADLQGVSAPSDSNAWAVGNSNGAPNTGLGSHALADHWNGTAWTTVPSPDAGTPSVLTSVSTSPGAAIVWAAGHSGSTGSFNPLMLQNG